MAEFKYACPVCGQHIKCDSSQSGSVMECPTCFQKITVPQAPATDETKFIIAGTKAGERPVPKRPEPGPTAPVEGFPVAAMVLILLVCAAGAAVFAFRGKIFKSAGAETNQIAGASEKEQTSAANMTNQAPPNPALAASLANDTNWTLNLDAATIPDSPVAGRINGKEFICQRSFVDVGALTLRTANRGPPDLGVTIYLHANRSEDLAGKSVNITSDTTNSPRVRLRWRDGQQAALEKNFRQGYALRVEF